MIKKLAGKQDTICKLWPLELCGRVKLDTPHCAVCYYSYIKFSCKTGFLFQLGCRNIFLSLLFMNTIRFTSKSWRSWKLESSLHDSKCKPLKTPITVGFVCLLCYSLHFFFSPGLFFVLFSRRIPCWSFSVTTERRNGSRHAISNSWKTFSTRPILQEK